MWCYVNTTRNTRSYNLCYKNSTVLCKALFYNNYCANLVYPEKLDALCKQACQRIQSQPSVQSSSLKSLPEQLVRCQKFREIALKPTLNSDITLELHPASYARDLYCTVLDLITHQRRHAEKPTCYKCGQQMLVLMSLFRLVPDTYMCFVS